MDCVIRPRINEGLERFRITHLAEAMGGELSPGQARDRHRAVHTHHPGCWCSTSPPLADPDVASAARPHHRRNEGTVADDQPRYDRCRAGL
jgi:hypothetical protein